jgi:hypothetical protein
METVGRHSLSWVATDRPVGETRTIVTRYEQDGFRVRETYVVSREGMRHIWVLVSADRIVSEES